jgi:ATP-dependent exoDNAse (exonuclease V) alpha subunit
MEGCNFNAAGEVYVANGEMGEAVLVEPGKMHIRVQSPERLVAVYRGKAKDDEKEGEEGESTNTGCKWELGYAISTHKSQGSAWPVVVVMLDDSGSATQICTREHIYTSISRAEQCCYLVGKLETARRYCRKQAINDRKTFLRERILQQLSPF